jgi:hypothetical protein
MAQLHGSCQRRAHRAPSTPAADNHKTTPEHDTTTEPEHVNTLRPNVFVIHDASRDTEGGRW